jgi:hypothetical protein
MAILPGATNGSVLADVNDLMSSAGLPLPKFTMATNPPDVTTADANDPVTVTITVLRANVDFMNTALLPTPANLTAEVTMAKEGF